MTQSEQFEPTEQTIARRGDRAIYDRATAYRILDDAFVAHVGFAVDGQPFVIPMVYGRDDDRLLLHGSVASRLMRALDGGAPACVTVTHVDGLVLARSHFHHSVNYRSVVVIGRAVRLRGDEARRAFEVIVDHAAPGRAAETRPADRPEERQTMILAVPIEQASVKVRTGPPVDEPSDEDPAVWAGVLPLPVAAGAPVADPITAPDVAPPASVSPWRRPGV